MTLSELKALNVDLHKQATTERSHNYVGALLVEHQALITRVEEVVTEMREGTGDGFWHPYPDGENVTIPASDAVRLWADRLEGKDE